MRRELAFQNWNDRVGNPAGGIVAANGLSIRWQDGPMGQGEDREAPNGVDVEDVLEAAVQRLAFLQNGRACFENTMAITKVQEAIHWLDARTRDREARGVEGTNAP